VVVYLSSSEMSSKVSLRFLGEVHDTAIAIAELSVLVQSPSCSAEPFALGFLCDLQGLA
jgi:hypothetical protein